MEEIRPDEPVTSEPEELLFGGPLRYDIGWSAHEDAFLQLNFRAMLRRLPALLASGFRLARAADRRAALTVHRPASVRHADLVHVLAQGRLVESGSPEELLASGGVYAELYALQADQFTRPARPAPPGRSPGTRPTPDP